MKVLQICHQCGKKYTAQRKNSVFCGGTCRVAYHRDSKEKVLVITQNDEDETEMLKWFSDNKKRVVRNFTQTDTKFYIDLKYWQEQTGLKQRKHNENPLIVTDVKSYRNKLEKIKKVSDWAK